MPRIHTLDVQRLTPLGQLLADYMRQQWPRLQTKAEFAHFIGVRPSTVDNLLYSQRAASSGTLNKIARATGIPAAVLYEAAAAQQAAQAPAPPRRREEDEPQRPTRIAEEQSPYGALDDYVRRVQAFNLPEYVKQAMIDTMVAAVFPASPSGWREQLLNEAPPWDDHDAISTMEYPAITASEQPSGQSSEQSHSERQSQAATARPV